MPDGAAQAEARELIRQIYGPQYDEAKTSAKKTALARKMLDQAAKTKGDPASHFVLLQVARDMAVQAGDANTALEAVDQIARTYQVDAPAMTVETLLQSAANARLSEQRTAVVRAAIPLIRAAIEEDDYERANRLVRKAQDLARKSGDAALRRQMVAINKEVVEAGKGYAASQQARAKLEEQPTDPEANLAVGRYLCLSKGDWEKGIPMLALGSDPSLRALAVRELEEVVSPNAQVALADAWWELAQGKTGPERESFLRRAGYWYQEAEASSTSELVRVKIRKRLEEIAKLGRSVADTPSSRPRSSRRSSRRAAIESWDVETVQHLGTLAGATNFTYALAFSPDGSTLASANIDTTVKLWNIGTGQCIRTFKAHPERDTYVYSVAFSPNGSTLAWAGANTLTVKVLNLATGELRQTPNTHTADIWTVAFSPDGSILASGSGDTTIRLWDVATGEMKRSLKAPARNEIWAIAISPNGSVLASGASADFPVMLWGPAPDKRR